MYQLKNHQLRIEKAIRIFLQAVIDWSTSNDNGVKGCFLATCVSVNVGDVEGVAERMEKAIEDTDLRLAARFDREKHKGNLSESFPSLDRASLLYDMRQGYVFRGRSGRSAEQLKRDLDERVRIILSLEYSKE